MSRTPSALQVGIGWILRAGVAVSLVVESAGLLLNYLQTGSTSPPEWPAPGGNFFGFTSSVLASISTQADPASIAGLGIAILVLTPYVRIIAAVVYYAVEKDWTYAVITVTVLGIVTLGLVAL